MPKNSNDIMQKQKLNLSEMIERDITDIYLAYVYGEKLKRPLEGLQSIEKNDAQCPPNKALDDM